MPRARADRVGMVGVVARAADLHGAGSDRRHHHVIPRARDRHDGTCGDPLHRPRAGHLVTDHRGAVDLAVEASHKVLYRNYMDFASGTSGSYWRCGSGGRSGSS